VAMRRSARRVAAQDAFAGEVSSRAQAEAHWFKRGTSLGARGGGGRGEIGARDGSTAGQM